MARESNDFYDKVQKSGRSDVDLAREAKCFSELNRSFIGVFTKDQLPKLQPNQCAIINIQRSHDARGREQPGTHWIAAGKKEFQPWSIDSFGLAPPVEVLGALGTKEPIHNDKTLQSADSSMCGDFALTACLLMASHPQLTAQQVVNKFASMFNQLDLTKNDRVLQEFLKTRAHHSSHHGIPYETFHGGNK